jgi:hypothetical protein
VRRVKCGCGTISAAAALETNPVASAIVTTALAASKRLILKERELSPSEAEVRRTDLTACGFNRRSNTCI